MNLKKMAARDANKWARAEMFFGDGAGTRRKLLAAEIQDKQIKIPGYREVFLKYYEKQDWAEHAIKAAKERKKIDRSSAIGKNARAFARGDRRNLLVATVVIGYTAHQLGYDKMALEQGKKYHRKLKAKIAEYKLAREPKKG